MCFYTFVTKVFNLSLSLYSSLHLAAPEIILDYRAQSAIDLGVDEVFVVGFTGMASFVVGESRALVCPYRGIEEPTAQWFQNDIIVDDSDPRINITQSTDAVDPSIFVSTLIIVNMTSADIGNYECQVSNNVVGRGISAGVSFIEVG